MKKYLLIGIASLAVLAGCDKDDDDPTPTSSNSNLELSITGLEDLGADYAYEGWIIVDGSPVSTGVFTVDADGNLSETSFSVSTTDLNAATMFVLSIEPVPDADAAPAATKILSGEFANDMATLNTGIVGDAFESSTGNFIIAAPTGTGDPSEEFSGLWFLDNSTSTMQPGLDLPTLSDGWQYEGWVVINGTPVTMGTFTATNVADDSAPYSGTNAGPAFPGEDFLVNAPSGLTFPTDLRGTTAVISIEPFPDNSAAPFTLKPLVGDVPATLPSTPIEMDNNVSSSFPTGTASR